MSLEPLPLKYEKRWYIPFQFYSNPFALSLDDWEKFDNEVKSKHPIQYFFRETLCTEYWIWRTRLNNFFWKIRNLIDNPRKEMRKAVFPSEYRDLPEIIIEFNIQVIKEIYEREKYFENFETEPVLGKTERAKFQKSLKKYYRYITIDREEMLKKADIMLYEDHKLSPNKRNKKWITQTQKVEKMDKEMCIWVASYKDYFWT